MLNVKNKRRIAILLTVIACMMCFPYVLLAEEGLPANGDLNADGKVTAADAAIVLRVLSGVYGDDTALSDEADVTANRSVTRNDALTVLMYAANYADTFDAITSTLNGSLLGENHIGRFTYRGPIQTENTYRSDSVCVTRTQIRYKDTDCFVADIYIRDIGALRTCFSSGKVNGRTQSVSKMAKNNDAIIAINGDYYTCNNKKGLLVRNGTLHRTGVSKNFETCAIYKDGHMEIFPPNTKTSVVEAGGDIWQTWTFGPSLIDENGVAKTSFTCNKSICGLNPRAAIGYYEPGHYCFVLADGRAKASRGLKMADLAAFMADELHCTLAYNFDGGQTAVMATRNGVVNNPFNGGRTTSDMVYICDPANPGGA